MEQMGVFFDERVQNLIDSFAYCFKVRITLFSSAMEVLFIGLQNEGCTYCQLLQQKVHYRYRCCKQDRMMCTSCEQNNKPLVYQCYAGLMESVIPIKVDKRLVGYAMLGQFRNRKKIPNEIIYNWKKKHNNSVVLQKAFNDQPYYEEPAIENMINLFVMLCSYIVSNEFVKVRRPEVVENVIRWIEKNISETIILDNVANTLGYSRSSISHTIKKNLHISFKQLCILKKIERFESLLHTNPVMSIQEAAFLVGYNDPLYFSRLYKKIRSVSPSVFLKSIRVIRN